MAVHKWRRRETKHFGDVWVPFAQIGIRRADGKFQSLAVQIDSGAVVSLLRRSTADLLGVDLESGKQIEVSSVGGGKTVAYVHELETRFDKQITLAVPFAIATSPLRAAGEPRNEADYQRVRHQFLRPNGKRTWDNWYCMSIRTLAESVGWVGEYKLWFALGSAWAHADPFQTQGHSAFPGIENETVFAACNHYYARMLLRVADNLVLTAEQHEFLQKAAEELS